MAVEEGKEEEKSGFTADGEVLGYIGLEQARILAMETAVRRQSGPWPQHAHRGGDSTVLSLFQCPKELLRSHHCCLPRKQLFHKNTMNLIILIRTAIREHQ